MWLSGAAAHRPQRTCRMTSPGRCSRTGTRPYEAARRASSASRAARVLKPEPSSCARARSPHKFALACLCTAMHTAVRSRSGCTLLLAAPPFSGAPASRLRRTRAFVPYGQPTSALLAALDLRMDTRSSCGHNKTRDNPK